MSDVKTTLSAELVAKAQSVRAFGADLAKSDAAFEMAIPNAATQVARIMGEKPSVEFWNAVAVQFQAAYAEQKKCAAKTAENRWYNVCDYMKKNFELEKPAVANKEAKRKQVDRAKQEKAIKAAKAQCVKASDAFQKAEELAKLGKIDESKIYQAAAHALTKEAVDNATKQAKEKLSEFREAMRKEIVNCNDVERFAAALEILRYGVGGKSDKPADKPAKAVRKAKETAQA